LIWNSAADKSKDISKSSISYGKSKSGETFNICRVLIGTSRVPGKVIDGKCIASLGGDKIVKEKTEFDVLIKKEK
jgi:hypothetical protein